MYVNLFIASRLDWRERGIRLDQTTDFPKSATTVLTISDTPGGEWPVHLRIPAWTTQQARVLINGRPLDAIADPGSYLRISRAWKAGDRIQLDMPMPVRSEGFPDTPAVQALMAGPVVLAAQMPRGDIPEALAHAQGPDVTKLPAAVPVLAAGAEPLDKRVKPVPGQPLNFTAAGRDGDIRFKPLNESWDRFAVYLDTSA
ncbi:MAG: hypothetical protein ACXU8U_12430 [Asticcacaulis sp.]